GPGAGIPHARGPVRARGDYPRAARVELRTDHGIGMARQSLPRAAVGGIPQPSSLVRAGRDRQVTRIEWICVRVAAEFDASDQACMPVQFGDSIAFAGGRLPNSRRLVRTGRDDELSV